jgi:hypothetical protein
MEAAIQAYNNELSAIDQEICVLLAHTINSVLTEAEGKIWHAHPAWFLDGNPVVGYSKQKKGIRLMFWSGADFDEAALNVKGGKFKDASIFYQSSEEVNVEDLVTWLQMSRQIQWDYKNLVKRKGVLIRIS